MDLIPPFKSVKYNIENFEREINDLLKIKGNKTDIKDGGMEITKLLNLSSNGCTTIFISQAVQN